MLTTTKKDFFWTADASDYQDNVEKKLRFLIRQYAEKRLEHKSGNTLSKEDMKQVIKKALAELAKNG